MPNTLTPFVTILQELLRPSDELVLIERYWIIGKQLAQLEQDGSVPLNSNTCRELAEGLRAAGVAIKAAQLRQCLAFFQTFPDRRRLFPELSWTHYRQLTRLTQSEARHFYLRQAAAGHWSTRELQRQIKARSFERLKAFGDDRSDQAAGILQLIRETYVLEFVRLPGPDQQMSERELEQALLDQLQYFLLELGTGFAFVGRQKRIATETGKQFFIDLVFYHVTEKCYVLVDLKIGELSHRDIGQMDMYVRLYDEKMCSPEDEPTIGIILCTAKDRSLVKYSLLNDNRRLFASTYILYLPDPDP